MARRGSDDDGLKPELERLYALPPPAFTAARNELIARLRKEGRRDAAATVKALPRPTPSSWAVSRLMRLEPARFQALLAAGRQARQAQRQVLGGGKAVSAAAPAARLRETLQSARTLIEELRRRGLEMLAASGQPATAASADRLSADLQALAFTAGAESAIERGWLDGDLDAPGFEVLAGLQAAAGPAAARARPKEAPPSKTKLVRSEGEGGQGAQQRRSGRAAAAERRRSDHDDERRRRQESLLQQGRERREREQARLQEARDRHRARLADAEAEVRRAEAESARLESAAADAGNAATDARRRAAEAQRDAERAERGAEQARRLLDRARERLEAVRAAAGPGLRASRAGRPRADETR
jgi:hypothetical protein